jgi:phosphoserine phosphatase RsbU/P
MPSYTQRLFDPAAAMGVFLRRQPFLFVIAVALYALVVILQVSLISFPAILIYTFVNGNLTWVAITALSPFYASLRATLNWIVFLTLLFIVALGASTLALTCVMAALRIPFSEYAPLWWSGGRLGILIVLIFGTVNHAYSLTRRRLENRNIELQRTVDLGHEQAHKQREELGKAREIQEGLLPKRIPQLRGFDVAGTWHPASLVGGDYFDVLKFGDRTLVICVGDVVGKGISAALLMANLQASFRAVAPDSASAGRLMDRLNAVICSNIAADRFVTFWCAMIDSAARKLSYANAGHWPPVLVRRSGAVESLGQGGPPLGLAVEIKYDDIEVPLNPGDRLVLYTDGVTEAADSDEHEYGAKRLADLVLANMELGASELIETTRRHVDGFCGGRYQDDFTLVVVAVK